MPLLHLTITKMEELGMSIPHQIKPQKLVLRNYHIHLTDAGKAFSNAVFHVDIDWIGSTNLSNNNSNHHRLVLFCDTEKNHTMQFTNWTFHVPLIHRKFKVTCTDKNGDSPGFVADGGAVVRRIDLVFDYEVTNRA